MIRFLLYGIFIVNLGNASEKENKVVQELAERKEIITRAAQSLGVSPRIVASIIYTERLRNFNWDDAILDNVLAKSGYNSSTGFAQIKVNTAFWIEEELHQPTGRYFLGKEIQLLLPRSISREELILRLSNDSVNISYCAAYAVMIKKRWGEAGYFFDHSNEAGLLATLFSLGIIRSNGEERLPHPNSTMNDFGRTAQEFFDSFVLREVFPN